MTVDLLFQAESPSLTGIKACLQAAVTGLRVDVNVVDGDLTSPMCLVESAGPVWAGENMTDRPDVVQVRANVTCIGTGVDLVTQLRAKCVRALVGKSATGAFYTALTVTGMRVIRRELTETTLPAPIAAGVWSNARLPVTLILQPSS